MKRITLGLLLISTGTTLATKPTLEIHNPGFESGKGDAASNWSWWSRTGAGAAKRNEIKAPEGRHTLCIEHDGERDWALTNDTKFDVRPGEAFKATASAKVANGHVVLAVVALRKGKLLSWDIGSDAAGVNKGWQRLEAIAEVPDDCDQIYLRFIGQEKTLAWLDDLRIERANVEPRIPKPMVAGHAAKRIREPLGRGLVARRRDDGSVYLGWRLLATDQENVGFHVYREVPGSPAERLTAKPVTATTDFIDKSPPKEEDMGYSLRPVVDGNEGQGCRPALLAAGAKTNPYLGIKLREDCRFRKVGVADLDGDGRYDYVIKHPHGNVDPYVNYWKKSPDTFKLEAYDADGKALWRHDLGWSIERGIWYSPYVVYDFNGDGRAEVAVKTGEGDPRDKDGRVQSGPEYLSILDGRTGKAITRTDWPSRDLFASTSRPYNYASRNQLGIAYLDGKTPCLIVERGTYNTIVLIAYELVGSELRELWQWNNLRLPSKYRGQGAHWMHAADVDGDGRDEVVIGSAVIDDNGDELWTTGLGHPDHSYIGDLDPARPGLEIYYGIESRQKTANGMCMVDAANGEIIWGHQGPTRHVHGHGMCSDIDATHPGTECFSTDTDENKKPAWSEMRTSTGKVLGKDRNWGFGPNTVYWDADPQREVLWKRRISDYGGSEHPTKLEGDVVSVADVLGDWREEIIVSVPGELRIYTTTIPATDRRPCLMLDPIYRIDAAHAAMGYTQVPMLSYDMATTR